MPTRRFKRIALAQLLRGACAAVFVACVLFEHAQAQPGYVPPPTPLPPPVFNPSNPYTVPQPSYTTAPVNERLPRTAARSHGTSVEKTRSVHHHRDRFAGPTLGSYYCGGSPCVRIVVAEPPPVYRASVLWWPGYYDYAPGQFGRGRPKYGGYGRRAGYHGD
jgi:hypothetical protein